MILKTLKTILNGFIFGATQIVPGVSGGTIAIIMGFYFELIETVNNITKNLRRSLVFLIPLLTGMVLGILILSSIINFLLTYYSFPTMLFFTGLICGIIPHLFSKTREAGRKFNVRDLLLIILPFFVIVIISFLRPEQTRSPEAIIETIGFPYILFIFFAGIVSAAALIIPGLSGSIVLLLLGVYHLAIYSVSSLRYWFADISNLELFLNICKVMVPLGAGILIGIFLTAKLIGRLVQNHQRALYLLMLGLLSGSVIVLLFETLMYQNNMQTIVILTGIAALVMGILLSFKTGKNRL